jgi:hypothetical protein
MMQQQKSTHLKAILKVRVKITEVCRKHKGNSADASVVSGRWEKKVVAGELLIRGGSFRGWKKVAKEECELISGVMKMHLGN